MSPQNLSKKSYREFFKRPIKPLQCNTNSNYCSSYETSCCNFSCPYAQKQKQKEILTRESRKPLLENIF